MSDVTFSTVRAAMKMVLTTHSLEIKIKDVLNRLKMTEDQKLLLSEQKTGEIITIGIC